MKIVHFSANGARQHKCVEYLLQKNIVSVLNTYEKLNKINGIWFHVPNESSVRLNPIQAKKRKCAGVKAGIPDFIFINGESVLGIELKSPSGSLNKAQRTIKDRFGYFGIPYHVVRSLEAFISLLERYNFLLS